MFASFLMSGVRVGEVVGWRSLILRLTHPMESLLVGAELALIQKNITIDIPTMSNRIHIVQKESTTN